MCSKVWQSEFLVYVGGYLMGKKDWSGLLTADVPNCDTQLPVAQ